MEIPNSSTAHYVLKRGEVCGPFTLDDLASGLADGRFEARDFFQQEGETAWRSMSRLLDTAASEGAGPVAPDWKCILKWAWLRLRYNLTEQSAGAGAICLLAAAVLIALSHWPIVFWLPWLMCAAVAGTVLIRHKREVSGTLLLVGTMAVPFAFALVGLRNSHREPTVAEVKPKSSIPGLPPPGAVPTAEPTTPANANDAVVETVAPPLDPPALLPVEAAPLPKVAVLSTAPTPAPVPSATATDSAADPAAEAAEAARRADLVQKHTDAFVIIKGQEGSGSGFACSNGDHTWLFTNIHVAADLKQPMFTRLDNVPIVPGAAEAAAGPDIVRFALPKPPAHPLEMMTDVDANVRIGDDVLVLGNSGGGGVVTSLPGVLKGLGPDRIEVTAEFIPGNSGSPIVHVKSGKVIGIATYLTRRYDEFASKSSGTSPGATPGDGTGKPPVVVRRFGYRIDNVPKWEPVNWTAFRGEATEIETISRLTGDIVHFLNALRQKNPPSDYATETLRRPATEWLTRVSNKHVSESDRINATQRFLGSLRAMSRVDTYAMDARLHYTYFRNELRDELQARDQLYEIFDKEASSFSVSTVHSAHGNRF